MKEWLETVKEIYQKKKSLFYMMVLLLVLSIILMVYALLNLETTSSVVKVGYGDIGRYQGGAWSSMVNSGGYHDGAWWNMLAFPLLALVFGILHNLLVVKLYKRKNEGMAKVFVMISILLVIATFVVLLRLLREG